MRRFVALVKKELLLLLRDPHGLLVLFAMPTIFILIMSLAMRDTLDPARAPRVEFVVHNESSDPLAGQLTAALDELPGFRRLRPPGLTSARLQAQLTDDDYKLAVVVPADFAERLRAWEGPGSAAPVRVLLSPGVSAQTRTLFELALSRTLLKLRLESVLGGGLALPMAELRSEYVFRDARPPATPTAVQQSVPAYLVFGMFFVVIPLATAFLVERQQGSLLRLQVMNVRPGLLLAAKIVPYYLVNQLQMLLMLLVGVYLVPRLGGDALNAPASWSGLVLIASATSLAAIGFALMIAAVARSGNAATTLGGGANIVLAALGGLLVPKFVMPEFMQQATALSPMSWGLEGFLDVFLRGGGWGEVLTEVGALTLFGGLCLAAAALLFRRQMRGLG